MKYQNIPNILTILRIILTIPLIYSLYHEQYVISLVIFLLAAISDGVDGFIARQFNCSSDLGAILDPLADKILIVSAFLLLTWLQKIPLWLCGLIILRDASIIFGAYYLCFFTDKRKITPSWLSKFNTVVQIALLTILIGGSGMSEINWISKATAVNYIIWIGYLVALTTLASGINYLFWLAHKIIQTKS